MKKLLQLAFWVGFWLVSPLIQQHVDQGISTTIFLKNTATTRDLTRIDAYAHHKGLKSLYYMRTKNVSMDDCLSCSV